VIVIANVSFFASASYYLLIMYYRKGKQRYQQYKSGRLASSRIENSPSAEVMISPGPPIQEIELSSPTFSSSEVPTLEEELVSLNESNLKK